MTAGVTDRLWEAVIHLLNASEVQREHDQLGTEGAPIMLAPTSDHAIDLRRLYWVGPATVAAAVVVVKVLQIVAVAILSPPERSLLRSEEPAVFTAVLVAIAVVVFAIVGSEASKPLRTYNRMAFVALVLSCLPAVALGFGLIRGEGWSLAVVFILMHVGAWAVTVSMLTHLTTSTKSPRFAN